MHGLGLVPTVQPLNPANLPLLRRRLTVSTSPPPRSLDRFRVAGVSPFSFFFSIGLKFSTEFFFHKGGMMRWGEVEKEMNIIPWGGELVCIILYIQLCR